MAGNHPPCLEGLRELFNCEAASSLPAGRTTCDADSLVGPHDTPSSRALTEEEATMPHAAPPRVAGIKGATTAWTEEERVVDQSDVVDNPVVLSNGLSSAPLNLTGQDGGNTRQRLLQATELMQQISKDKTVLDALLSAEERAAFLDAAGRVVIVRQNHDNMNKRRWNHPREDAKARDDKLLNRTGIRRLRDLPVFPTPPSSVPTTGRFQAWDERGNAAESNNPVSPRRTEIPRHCYVCKAPYEVLHSFYDQLCCACADLNHSKRGELADLSGKVALLTGGRVKIGYQAGVKLLRCGARLIVTTRFPRNAANRYAAEADFGEWGHRLDIFGLDLRHTPSVVAFCQSFLDGYERLDFIVNNACQTIRRPPGFYEHMAADESRPLDSLNPKTRKLLEKNESLLLRCRPMMLPRTRYYGVGGGSEVSLPGPESSQELVGLTQSVALSQTPLLKEDDVESSLALFPTGQLDQDLQQVDLRDRNSWKLHMHEVSATELLETQLVNAVAPFVLNAKLKPLMEATPGAHKHIVNVSAMEGQFYRQRKTVNHPHTNMAKAALNMMTRTAAADYLASGIHMNSVDTGWVTDENPVGLSSSSSTKQRAGGRRGRRFHPPLDIIDGAARVVDPIIGGVNTGTHVWGQFLKDYKPTVW